VAGDINVGGNTVSWTTALPNNGNYGNVSQVRLEIQERQYTCLFTVRNNSAGIANVDIVTFFKRQYNDPDGNRVHQCQRNSTREYRVQFASGEKPSARKGGYLLDVNGGFWYRIQKVVEGSGESTVTIEGVPAQIITQASFPADVVDVYPLGVK